MRLRRIVVATIVCLVTLEGVLQIGAFAMTAFVAPQAAPAGASVLCVGDSYTFGVGATSPDTSYPGQLAKRLAARGIANSGVVNAAFPGQHSADVLTKLTAQMTPSTKVLCVLVGTNDSWCHPPRVDPAELAHATGEPAEGDFQWCWRTGRLLQLITNFEANVWKQSGDGAAAETGTNATAKAAQAPAPAGPTAEDTAFGFAELDKWGLVTGEAYVGRYEPDPSLPDRRNEEFWRCMQARDFAGALVRAEQNVRDFPDSPRALLHLVTAATSCGQRAKALDAVDRLVQLGKTKPSAAATECLIEGYLSIGQAELVITSARQRIAEQPLSITAWHCLQQATFELGRREEALVSMAETIRLVGRREPWRSAWIARNLARFWVKDDPAKAVGLLVGSHFVDGDTAHTRISIQVAHAAIDRAQFEAAIAALDKPESASVRALAGILDEVFAGKGAELWVAILREHLAAMHDLAARRGIPMVVLSYPFLQEAVERQQRDTARALGLPFVAIRERFDQELKTRKREDLFVADGHCNDAGYAIMADMVAEAVTPLLVK